MLLAALLLLIAALVAAGIHKTLWALEGIERQLRHLNIKGGRIMATADELVAAVKAFKEEASAKLGEAVAGVDEAVAELGKINDLLDAGTGGGADIDGAMAAIDELRTTFGNLATSLGSLKTAVDRPEPGVQP